MDTSDDAEFEDTAGDGDMLYLETADSILGSESADASAMRPAGALEAGTSLSTPANAAAARLAMMSNSSNVSVARVGVAAGLQVLGGTIANDAEEAKISYESLRKVRQVVDQFERLVAM